MTYGRYMLALVGVLCWVGASGAQTPQGGTLSADGAFSADVTGLSTASITVSGTYSGTINFEVVAAPGTAAVTVDCATFAAPGSAVNSTTGTGTWVCPVAGATLLQARMSSYASGAAVIGIVSAANPGQSVAAGGGGGSFDGVLVDAAGGDALTDTANNALRVNIVAGAGSGGTAIADDAAFTVATTSVTPAGGLFDDVSPDSVNEGDAGAVRMSANRNLYSTIRDAAGNERGANVNASNQLSVSVDNTATVTGTVTANAGTNLNTSALLTTAAFQTAFGTGSIVTSDACDGGDKVTITINQTADTQLFTGTASNRTHFCSIMLRQASTSTQTFNLVSGTGTTCGTSVGPVIGGTTAAHGSDLPFVLGTGSGTVAMTDTDADNVCLLQSGSDRITGVITYVVAPQ